MELAVRDGYGGEGRAEGWDISTRQGGRLAAVQLLQEEVCGGEEGGDIISGAVEGSSHWGNAKS